MWSNDMKCKYMFMFPLQNLARKEPEIIDLMIAGKEYACYTSLMEHTPVYSVIYWREIFT